MRTSRFYSFVNADDCVYWVKVGHFHLVHSVTVANYTVLCWQVVQKICRLVFGGPNGTDFETLVQSEVAINYTIALVGLSHDN